MPAFSIPLCSGLSVAALFSFTGSVPWLHALQSDPDADVPRRVPHVLQCFAGGTHRQRKNCRRGACCDAPHEQLWAGPTWRANTGCARSTCCFELACRRTREFGTRLSVFAHIVPLVGRPNLFVCLGVLRCVVLPTRPRSKAVYIAPLKALVSERMKDWRRKFQTRLGWRFDAVIVSSHLLPCHPSPSSPARLPCPSVAFSCIFPTSLHQS